MIYLFNKIPQMPFDTKKEPVIMGRGKLSRDNYLFNLEKVNLFFLNYQPPGWALSYYKRKYPKVWKKSLFAFIHPDHLEDLQKVQAAEGRQFEINILTWKGKLEGIRTNNISVAAADWLGGIKVKGNIYLSAFDFDNIPQWRFRKTKEGREWWLEERDWKYETRYLKQIFKKYVKIKYQFITYNQYFRDYMPIDICEGLKKKLIESRIINLELTAEDIQRIYKGSGTPEPREPGEVLREVYYAERNQIKNN